MPHLLCQADESKATAIKQLLNSFQQNCKVPVKRWVRPPCITCSWCHGYMQLVSYLRCTHLCAQSTARLCSMIGLLCIFNICSENNCFPTAAANSYLIGSKRLRNIHSSNISQVGLGLLKGLGSPGLCTGGGSLATGHHSKQELFFSRWIRVVSTTCTWSAIL